MSFAEAVFSFFFVIMIKKLYVRVIGIESRCCENYCSDDSLRYINEVKRLKEENIDLKQNLQFSQEEIADLKATVGMQDREIKKI